MPPQPVPELTPTEVQQRLGGPRPPLLLDVREGWEFGQGSLPGAVHAPLSNFAEALGALSLPLGAEVVTFCHHGVRSLRAAAALREGGFAHVASMAGGIDGWSLDVDAAVLRY